MTDGMYTLDLPTGSSKSICIIGAGPTGLAALKVILDTPQHKSGLWKAFVFEARDKVGGIWHPAPPTTDPPLTPLYDSMTTNLPHPVMAFTSYSFPPSTPVYPHASVVQTYLESYAAHFQLTPHIHLNTTVTSVEYASSKWKVKTLPSTNVEEEFDLVVVCNGHYRNPRYPAIPGLAQWLNKGKASHSAWYRRPRDYGATVLVIGGGPSGRDISEEMRSAARTVIHSVTDATPEDMGNLKRRGRVARFEDDGSVVFQDGSSEANVDYCILATGYEVCFPFMGDGESIINGLPPRVPPLPAKVFNTTYGVFPLAKHLFPMQCDFPPSSLSFPGLLVRVVPFPLVEAQARAIIHVFAHPEALDLTQEAVDVVTRHEELRARVGSDDPLGIAKAWFRFEPEEQFVYRDRLCEFVEGGGDGGGRWGKVRVKEWERECYEKKEVLRRFWNGLVESGVADEWVRGVGDGGPHEWVDLLKKMIKKAEDKDAKL